MQWIVGHEPELCLVVIYIEYWSADVQFILFSGMLNQIQN